jgi:Glycosyl hydrolase family 92.
MSAWFVMATLGLFQTDRGCSINLHYEIASPLYEEIAIHLGKPGTDTINSLLSKQMEPSEATNMCNRRY